MDGKWSCPHQYVSRLVAGVTQCSQQVGRVQDSSERGGAVEGGGSKEQNSRVGRDVVLSAKFGEIITTDCSQTRVECCV